MTIDRSLLHAHCVGTTGDAFSKSIEKCSTAWPTRSSLSRVSDNGGESNFFREAQFSADGTTIVTHNEDQCLRTFVLPGDLLDEIGDPHALNEHSRHTSPSNIQSYAVYPYFNLQDPSSTLVLTAAADQPISLLNALNFTTVHAKYSFISPTTEDYIRASSLAFTRDGRHFIAGSKNSISVFDCSYDGAGPIATHKTYSDKRAFKRKGALPTANCRGLVSALNIRQDGLLAAGTLDRQIALYQPEANGECVSAFSLGDASDPGNGTGVTALKWSPCGNYLIIAERQSGGMHVYDTRNARGRVAWLAGRKADTAQRLGIDMVPTADGCEMWAGGTDGCVRMWSRPGMKEGEHLPDAEMNLHDDAVSSTIWHPQGAVLATTSGSRSLRSGIVRVIEDEESSSDESDSSSSDISEMSSSDDEEGDRVAEKPLDNRLNVWTVA